MLVWSLYLIFLLKPRFFSCLFTSVDFWFDWVPLCTIDEITTSHNWLKIFLTPAAGLMILVAMSVGIKLLLILFVPINIKTTSAFGFFFVGGFV